MNKGDFRFATDLANTMDWNMAPEDFQYNSELEPGGCFVAFHGEERIGVSTCISFGKVGWFGNLVVNEKYRNKGVGSLLLKRSIDYLLGKGVQTIGIYAYIHLIGFYSKMGFKVDEDFTVLQAETMGTVASEALLDAGRKQIGGVEEFDGKYFGASRKKLLESIILDEGNLSYVKCENGEVTGYVAATVYEKMAWVGPLMCREGETHVATALLKEVLSSLKGKSVYVALPKKELALTNMLFTAGFREDFSVCRMFLGKVVAKNCIYMAESLERG